MFDASQKRAAAALARVLAKYSNYLTRAGFGFILAGMAPSKEDLDKAEGEARVLGSRQLAILATSAYVRSAARFEFKPVGLGPVVEELQRDWARKMRGARNVLGGIINDPEVVAAIQRAENFDTAARVGRRTADWVRTAKLESLVEAFEAESPIAKGSRLLQQRLRFMTEGGLRFPLQIQNVTARAPFVGLKYQAWDVRNYAEMAALTTVREAEQQSEFALAEQLGSNLVKMPRRGKAYRAEGDFVCARLDGNIFSLKQNDPDGFPWLWGPAGLNRDPDGYKTAHPRCSHIGVAITRAQALAYRAKAEAA